MKKQCKIPCLDTTTGKNTTDFHQLPPPVLGSRRNNQRRVHHHAMSSMWHLIDDTKNVNEWDVNHYPTNHFLSMRILSIGAGIAGVPHHTKRYIVEKILAWESHRNIYHIMSVLYTVISALLWDKYSGPPLERPPKIQVKMVKNWGRSFKRGILNILI